MDKKDIGRISYSWMGTNPNASAKSTFITLSNMNIKIFMRTNDIVIAGKCFGGFLSLIGIIGKCIKTF